LRQKSENSSIRNNKKISQKNQYNRLLLAGGDGSVSFAFNGLLKNNFNFNKDFAIGYIPAGTANILQAELGMSKNLEQIAKTLTSNNFNNSNLMKINEKPFVLMAGLGWDAQIVQSINSSIKKIMGKLIFGIKGLQKFLFMKNNKIKIFIDNETIYADWVLCTNSKYYAGHHSIAKTNFFDDKVVTYFFENLNRLKLLYYIYLVAIYGNLEKSKSVITKYDDNIKFEGLNSKIPVQIDGDNFGNFKEVLISKSEKKINIFKSA
jgi:Sphingosine kinase and enzymes related to eukaryotic diacylglycerol kinase